MEKELIKNFVTQRFMEDNRQSCLVMALETARILSGRDKKNGESRKTVNTGVDMPDLLDGLHFEDNQYMTTGNFGGLIHYLMLLDLIGNVFVSSTQNPICRALREFSSITDDKTLWAIVGLRNSLAHNYGLVSEPKNQSHTKHKFCLHLQDEMDEMIKIPTPAWDGDCTNKDEKASTDIDVYKLIDAIEEMYQNIKKKAEKGELKLIIDEAELKARFTINT